MSARRLLRALALAACGLCLFFALRAAQCAEALYPAAGLRYETPLSAAQVQAARRYAQEAGQGVFPTFWRQEQRRVRTQRAAAQAGVIAFCGDGGACFAADFVCGGMPGAQDAAGCALSEALAQELFGAADVVGLPLTMEAPDGARRVYTVRGVFAGDRLLALAGAGENEAFTCVELQGELGADETAAAREFAASAGLGEPDAVCVGAGAAALAKALCFAPLALAALGLAARLLRSACALAPPARGAALLALAVCAALALPAALGALPGWMIPARWSDFSFWPALAGQLADGVRAWLSLRPFEKDVQAKLALLHCAAHLAGAWAALAGYAAAGRGEEKRPREALRRTAEPPASGAVAQSAKAAQAQAASGPRRICIARAKRGSGENAPCSAARPRETHI